MNFKFASQIVKCCVGNSIKTIVFPLIAFGVFFVPSVVFGAIPPIASSTPQAVSSDSTSFSMYVGSSDWSGGSSQGMTNVICAGIDPSDPAFNNYDNCAILGTYTNSLDANPFNFSFLDGCDLDGEYLLCDKSDFITTYGTAIISAGGDFWFRFLGFSPLLVDF